MAKQVIVLLGQPIYAEDDKAAEAITPGHLVGYDSSGNIVKHATSAGTAARDFADMRDELGNGIDVAYAADDVVKVARCYQGMAVNAIIMSGVSVLKGAYLESAGNGSLKARSGNFPVAMALEAKTAAFTGNTRIRVQIL